MPKFAMRPVLALSLLVNTAAHNVLISGGGGSPDPSVDCSAMAKRECKRNEQHCAYHSHMDLCRNHDGCIDLVHRDDCLSNYECFWTGQSHSLESSFGEPSTEDWDYGEKHKGHLDHGEKRHFPCQVYEPHVSCGELDEHLCAKNPRCFFDSQWQTCYGSEDSDLSGRLAADNIAGVGRYRGDPCVGKQKKQCLADPDCEYKANTESPSDKTQAAAAADAAGELQSYLDGTNWDFKGSQGGDACRSASAAVRAKNHKHERPTDIACGDLFNKHDCHGHRSGCMWDECLTDATSQPACHVNDCCGRKKPHFENCNKGGTPHEIRLAAVAECAAANIIDPITREYPVCPSFCNNNVGNTYVNTMMLTVNCYYDPYGCNASGYLLDTNSSMVESYFDNPSDIRPLYTAASSAISEDAYPCGRYPSCGVSGRFDGEVGPDGIIGYHKRIWKTWKAMQDEGILVNYFKHGEQMSPVPLSRTMAPTRGIVDTPWDLTEIQKAIDDEWIIDDLTPMVEAFKKKYNKMPCHGDSSPGLLANFYEHLGMQYCDQCCHFDFDENTFPGMSSQYRCSWGMCADSLDKNAPSDGKPATQHKPLPKNFNFENFPKPKGDPEDEVCIPPP